MNWTDNSDAGYCKTGVIALRLHKRVKLHRILKMPYSGSSQKWKSYRNLTSPHPNLAHVQATFNATIHPLDTIRIKSPKKLN